MTIVLSFTTAGFEALAAATRGDPLVITAIGLTDTPFVTAPTLTELPGQHTVLNTVAGQAIDSATVHLTATDASSDVYVVHGFGLFLADGTLLATYSQDDPIVGKSVNASLYLAVDVTFAQGQAQSITFGATNFLVPLATTTQPGLVQLATQAAVDAGTDPEKVVTPATLKVRIDAAIAALVNDAPGALDQLNELAAAMANDPNFSTTMINALAGKVPNGRRVSSAGLLTGGGDLFADRTLTVEAATAAEALAGAVSTKAVTPASLALILGQLAAVQAALPVGAILQWHGDTTNVPAGWAICDGRQVARTDGNGNITTPDLRDRVIVGAGGAHVAGDTFGATSKTVTSAQSATGMTLTTTNKTDTAGGGSGLALNSATLNDPQHAHQVTVDVTQPSFVLLFIMKI